MHTVDIGWVQYVLESVSHWVSRHSFNTPVLLATPVVLQRHNSVHAQARVAFALGRPP